MFIEKISTIQSNTKFIIFKRSSPCQKMSGVNISINTVLVNDLKIGLNRPVEPSNQMNSPIFYEPVNMWINQNAIGPWPHWAQNLPSLPPTRQALQHWELLPLDSSFSEEEAHVKK